MMKKISKIEDVNMLGVSFNYEDIIDGSKVKNELTIKYGIWAFLHSENVTPKDALQGLWNSFINLYGDDIERINDALQEEYNILDNYNGETTTTYGEKITNNGTKTITNVIGEVNETKTSTNVIGKVNGSTTHGATSVTLGGGTDSQLLEKANSESSSQDSFLSDNKTTQIESSRTNTSTEYTDSNEIQSHTDTLTDTNDIEEHTDTTTDSGNIVKEEEHSITEIKRGNLGLTTSQQLLTSEVRLRAINNFYDIVIKMFLNRYLFICE